MDTETTLKHLHQLVQDYNNRRLSMADYRLERRKLLANLDARINGVSYSESSESHLITIRKHH